jgi:hypothetical protein
MMRIFSTFLLILLLILGCSRGYREGEPLTGEELRLAQKATEMMNKVEQLNEKASRDLGDSWKQFMENVRLFDNSCQRRSCNSLEARNDFNHLRYYAVQLDQSFTKEAYPDLYDSWKSIRKNYVDEIGKELGYRIE